MPRKPNPVPPSDRGDRVTRRYKSGKIEPDALYEAYERAGLSPEEAAELADLVEGE